jgi:glycosyltransferase involved in cell wall biosynthesis
MERILQVVTYMGRGGIETMLMNYYRHMDREKIQFDFLVHRDFRADFDDEIEALGGRIYRVPPMNPASGSYRKALADFFREHPYRVVHCHQNYMSGIILAAAKKAGVSVRIAHAHTANMAPGWKQAVRRMCKYLIPATATHYFACSTEAGKAIFGRQDFSILANAIDASGFVPDGILRNAVRSELGLGDNFTVIHVGRMVYAKNHEFLLDAFRELLHTEPGAKLVLIGDGELRPEIEAKAAQLPAGSVLILGSRTDISRLLQAADVFAFPSHFEGLPVTMIEAQTAGLPCVKSDTITDECVVTDLVTSLPITDPALWAEEILKKRGIPRADRLAEIQASGYDISTAAAKLTRFYLNGESL